MLEIDLNEGIGKNRNKERRISLICPKDHSRTKGKQYERKRR
jgi:hypothetical protein